MSAASQPDYDALAKKYGSVQEPDYDALAQKYGTIAPAEKPPEPSAMSRFLSGAKAGMGGENALNTEVDPQHPISSNPMIPGAGVYRDIKSGDYAGAAGRVLAPAASLAVALGAGRGSGEMPAVEPAEPSIAKPSVLGTRVKAIGKVAAQDAASHIPVAGRLVRRPSLGDYMDALTAKPPSVPGKVASPDVYRPGYSAPRAYYGGEPPAPIPPRQGLLLKGEVASEPKPVYPGAKLPEAPPAEVRQASSLYRGAKPIEDPAEGLGKIPVREPGAAGSMVESVTSPDAVQNSIAKPKVDTAKLGDALNESLGGRIPEGHTPVKGSSVIRSFKYNPATRELETGTSGGTYIHGDVDPETFQKFQSAKSKGQAWKELKDSPGVTYVGKIVNGERVAAKPPRSLGSATPDDLTNVLEQSVADAKAKKIARPSR